MTSLESPYFEVISPSNSAHKVGAGLPTTYRVLFTPDDRKVTLCICSIFFVLLSCSVALMTVLLASN